MQFSERTVSKTYWAFVEGHVTPDEGTWRDYLHKRHGMAQAEVVDENHPAGKHAVLHYRVIWRSELGSWLEIELETGRTHQIRVQSAPAATLYSAIRNTAAKSPSANSTKTSANAASPCTRDN